MLCDLVTKSNGFSLKIFGETDVQRKRNLSISVTNTKR